MNNRTLIIRKVVVVEVGLLAKLNKYLLSSMKATYMQLMYGHASVGFQSKDEKRMLGNPNILIAFLILSKTSLRFIVSLVPASISYIRCRYS